VLQWVHADVPGPQDGLAVDNFFLTPTLATFGGAPVPEPSTWSLMIAGFAGLAIALWRRRRVSA
jgi:PEP-CTERM motif